MAGFDVLVTWTKVPKPGLACPVAYLAGQSGNASKRAEGKQGALGAVGSSIQERSWEWDWDWEAGRREQESLAGSRGTPHPVAVGFPAIPTPIPRPIPTGRGMPWPFPRLANLATKALSSAGLLLEAEEKALQRSKSRMVPKPGRFP